MTTPFDPGDTFDSRDVVERIEDLSNDEGALTTEEADELTALRALRDEVEGYCDDWQYDETFIADRYFEVYARELAEDIGAISGKEQWPLTCIDWQQAARELQQDYSSVEFDGTTYWYR